MNDYERMYLAAHYCVSANPDFVLIIDQPSAPLENLYCQYNTRTAAFITAWNPYSNSLPDIENRERNLQLEHMLQRAGFNYFPGIGKDPSGTYAGEDSFLVLGITQANAFSIGKQFEQNAIVFCGENAVPELLWMTS